jgi:tetratricopeptide (TPR) repeat protein
MYRKALDYWPGNARVLAALGALYVRLEEYEKARPRVERALENASDDLMVYDGIIRAWIDVGDLDEAWRVMKRAEASVETIPYEFYVSQASYCIDYADKAVPRWLDRAVEKAPPGAPVLVMIGEMAIAHDVLDLAKDYLERALEAGQMPGQAHLALGVVALERGDTARAERHWRDALTIARRTNDQDLEDRVEEVRMIFHAPPDLLDLIGEMGPGAFADGAFPDFLDDDLNGW